jgi:tungstate transport system substrate-binding protein
LFKSALEIVNQKRLSGDDLFRLLESIVLYGTISRAAAEAGVSYRYAWGLLQEAEKALGLNLLDKHVGGYAGGGSLLTADGKRLLHEYKEYKQTADRRLDQFINKIGPVRPRPARSAMVADQPHGFLLLASSLEPVESGLLDELESAFFRENKILVRHLAAGSGRALEIAREGRVDMALTHAPEMEEQFMAEGWGVKQLPIMTSDFLLAGPAADPAGLGKGKETLTVAEAFRRIALSRSPFVTRGDHSGTHLREVEIWEKSGITPGGDWYLFYPGVAGNLGALSYACAKKAYMLADAVSFRLSRTEGEMSVFIDGAASPAAELVNIFVLTLVNPEKVPSAHLEEAGLFARWLQEGEGSRIIANFGRRH